MNTLIRSVFASLLAQSTLANAASVTIQWSTNSLLQGNGLSSLGPGTSADGDGALLQLGYFSNATLASPFAGHWIVLATGTVGDQGVDQAGLFSISTILTDGPFAQPAVGTPLGVRFFDGTSEAASSFYNTAVNNDGSGLWVSPADPAPSITLTLSKAASALEAGEINGFRTTIPVPEPGTAALCLLSLGALLCNRRVSPRP